jgi:hypothetical protein
MSSKRESRRELRSFDFPTAVGPKKTTTGGEALSSLRVAIPDLLRKNLLESRGDDLAVVGIQLIVAREVDLYAALHCRAGHFINVSLEAFQEIER